MLALRLSMQLSLDRKYSPLLESAQRFLLRRLVNSYEPYHPVYLSGVQISAGERSCVDRWHLIEPYLRDVGSKSVLDLGCAEGYFVQQAAKNLNCLSIGIDADLRRLTIARMTATLNAIAGACFIYDTLDSELLRRLPEFDTVFFLSVLHHIMYEHGEEYALQLVREIRRVTRRCLIFDMGQSDEVQHEWSKLLPDMSPNPQTWIGNFLRSAGYSDVAVIGQTDAYKSDVRRFLFTAKP
jgi:SAM-dependent methyltransferase